MKKMSEELFSKYQIQTIRRVRGDGNCYYRAVYYAYIELVISKDCIKNLISLQYLGNEQNSMKAPPGPYFNSPELVKEAYPYMVLQLQELQGIPGSAALKRFYIKAALDDFFDQCAIKFIRLSLYNFLIYEKDLLVNGLPLIIPITTEGYQTVEEYANSKVLKMGEDASILVPILVPYIFRCSIYMYVLDTRAGEKIGLQKGEAEINGKQFELKDGLDLHKEALHILLKPGHYDMLSKKVTNYDKDFLQLEIETHSKWSEKVENIPKENQEIIQQIKTPCCGLEVEKADHISQLIKENKGKLDAEHDKLSCPLCGNLNERSTYKTNILSREEITDLLNKCLNQEYVATPCCGRILNRVICINDFRTEYLKNTPLDLESFSCPYCAESLKNVREIIGEDNVQLIIKQVPHCVVCKKLAKEEYIECTNCNSKYCKECFKMSLCNKAEIHCSCGKTLDKVKEKVELEGRSCIQ
eukprot:TRINITY_DN242_c0_g1_i1.p3 TRINITY_DN242_c0_g1~~TRINITY_DN242_c0_g1_i1.p3  ORF type:complete len:470 (+),score=50.49 TRINITY_DN242_c0_g1_i1:5385-6794(+)